MVSLGANGNIKTYGIKHFILDETADIEKVENVNDLAVGSTIFVIATSEHYMLNGSKKWIKVNLGTGSGGGGGGNTPGEDEDLEIEYDGGDVL